jgi:adenylate cyclase
MLCDRDSVAIRMKATSPTALAAFGAIVLTLFVALLLHLPFFAELESETGDQMVAFRYWLNKREGVHKPDARLFVVAIDQGTIEDLGGWPLPRKDHGQFLQVLAPEKPAEVGWDIFFTEARDPEPSSLPPAPGAPAPAETDDQVLVDGAALFPHMVTASKKGEGTSEPLTDEKELLPTRPLKNVIGSTKDLFFSEDAEIPFPALRRETYFGFADEPGTIRRIMPLVVNINGMILPSFDLQVILQYWGIDPDQVTVEIGHAITFSLPQGGSMRIPIDQTGCMTLNYRARLEDFRRASYARLGKGLADKSNQASSPERDQLPSLKDSIVIVGVTFAGTDAGPIPLDPTAPLVVTHLNVINNILQRDFLRTIGPWAWMPIYALFLFGVGCLTLRLRVVPMLLVDVAAFALIAGTGFALLYLGNALPPVTMPEVGMVLLAVLVPARGFFGEEREKLRIKGAMRAYLSDKVMAKVLEHPDNLKLGGVKQEITIMFCDIRGFTAYCDHRDPQETMDVLNEYMEIMTQVVFKFDGTIDKYIGDCIMAFWNAPEPQPDHAQRAVLCAMEMRQALATFKTQRAGHDAELFECGIGIHTGEALVGNMGSSLKRNYTAMGSTVNLGARLESLTKALQERILISEDTFLQLHEPLPITDRGEVEVSGFDRPVHVYAVVTEQVIAEALRVGRILAGQQEYTAQEVQEPLYAPTPPPEETAPDQEPS